VHVLLGPGNNGTFKSIMQYLCLLNTQQQFFLFRQKNSVYSNQKKNGNFFFFLVKIQLSLLSILKFWPNFKYHKIERGKKKTPTKQLLGFFL
jgi:hypothetical protein